MQELQERVDAGQCTEAGVQRHDNAVKMVKMFKRAIHDARQLDRDLGEVFASSGLRTRKTPIGGTSTIDWALVRITADRLGTNLVRDLVAQVRIKCD